MSRCAVDIVAIAFKVLAAAELLAQAAPAINIAESPACVTCKIVVSREVVLGDADGPGSFARYTASVVRTSRGEYVVVDGNAPPQIFDSKGRYVRTLGRRGQGPGEFKSVDRVVRGTGDSLLVFEPFAFSVFSPAGVFVRRVTTSFRGGFVESLPNGTLLVRAAVGTREAAGHAFHVVGMNGSVIRSFGDRPPLQGPPTPIYLMAATAKDRFWVGQSLKYEMTELDGAGRTMRTIRATPRWFTATSTDGRPRPVIWTFHSDAQERLWVVGAVSLPNWKDAMPQRATNGSLNVTNLSPSQLRSSIIDVIDPARGQVLASLRFPGFVIAFVGDDRLAVVVETSDGVPKTEIWRVHLQSK